MDIREELVLFTNEMENVLKENDHRGEWQDEDMIYLFERLKDNVEELESTFKIPFLEINDFGMLIKSQRKALLDIANYCMMLHHTLSKK